MLGCHLRRWVWLLPFVGVGVGCVPQPVSGPPSAPPVVIEEASPVAPDPGGAAQAQRQRERKAILRLLNAAEASMARQELTTPEERNAYLFYRQVLKIDPDNSDALKGLEMIVLRYIEWADAALQRGAVDKARVYLARAQGVDAQHPEIPAGLARINRARTKAAPVAEQDPRFRALNAQQLAAQSPLLKKRLAELADEIKARDTRIQIEAPNDRQGRWIYQQLNERHEEYRIRASLKLSQRPGVRLLD